VKRKATKQKTANNKPSAPAKPLRNLGGEALRNLPSQWEQGSKRRTEVNGVTLPPDLEQGLLYYSRKTTKDLVWRLRDGLRDGWVERDEWVEDEIYPPLCMDQGHVDEIFDRVRDSMREMFYLAVLHYADDLKKSEEATPFLETLRNASRKGGEARHAKAQPVHKAICKRFRELRKTVPKKTARYLRIHRETGLSERQIMRIVKELD